MIDGHIRTIIPGIARQQSENHDARATSNPSVGASEVS